MAEGGGGGGEDLVLTHLGEGGRKSSGGAGFTLGAEDGEELLEEMAFTLRHTHQGQVTAFFRTPLP